MVKEIDIRKISFPNVDQSFSDLVNKYFFKRYSGQMRAASKARDEVLATGLITEKLLDYYYTEIWEPHQTAGETAQETSEEED